MTGFDQREADMVPKLTQTLRVTDAESSVRQFSDEPQLFHDYRSQATWSRVMRNSAVRVSAAGIRHQACTLG